MVESLQVSTQGEVEQKRKDAEIEGAQRADSPGDDRRVSAEVLHPKRGEREEDEQDSKERRGEEDAVIEPAVGLMELAGPVRLREDGIQAQKNASHAKRKGVVEDLRQRNRAHRDRRVGHVADHDGVDDPHGHPPDLCSYQRKSECEHGTEFMAKVH